MANTLLSMYLDAKNPQLDPEDLFIPLEDLMEYDLDDLMDVEYWSVKDAAMWLNVAEKTVKDYVRKGLLKPHHRGAHNKYLFNHFDIVELGWKLDRKTMKFSEEERSKYIAKQLLSTDIGRNALYEVIYTML